MAGPVVLNLGKIEELPEPKSITVQRPISSITVQDSCVRPKDEQGESKAGPQPKPQKDALDNKKQNLVSI